MSAKRVVRVRRTQAERTAETRAALVAAAIGVVHRLGYGAATTALIADEAGITRGAILHHFGTRAELMAEVIRSVFDQEVQDYDALIRELRIGRRVSDWVELCWRILSRPSGLAVLEILLASRSDPELAARLEPIQHEVEHNALAGVLARFPGGEETALARMRLIVWAIRGLALGDMLTADAGGLAPSVALLRSWLRAAEDAGVSLFAPPPQEPGKPT
ncbi:MAG TPA: TetR/AcrR family transcriptional regulator [Phenylobacterium sp.]